MSDSEERIRAPIRRLDEATVSQIAAGEVVERPASVVKELVENAIDAEAGEVVVHLEGGGLDSIEVADDGFGIPEIELPVAVERHTTSKIRASADLEQVRTLGFRGEALAAIGSVAHLRIISRPTGADEAHGVSVVGGALAGQFVAGRAPGTTVEVRELFFNTPARRKFLRSAPAEQVEVAATLERIYAARPDVGLTLYADSREVERLPPTHELANAAARILGPEFADAAVAVRGETKGGLSVEGWVSRPPLSRPTSQGLYLSINGRTIDSRALGQAVRAAYGEYLPRGRFPSGVLHLAVDPQRLDVNVHPTKREVRLVGERDVAEFVRRSVRAALVDQPQLREATAGLMPAPVSAPAAPTANVPDRPEPVVSLPFAASLVAGNRVRDSPSQTTLIPLPGRVRVEGDERHPALHLIGSLMDLYWIAEAPGALLLLDQHAASERVLFEAVRAGTRIARQTLVEPATLTLTARWRSALREHETEVRAAGFEIEPLSRETYRVLSVPVFLGHRAAPEAVPALLEEIAAGGRATVPSTTADRIAATVACHAAVRAGDRISAEEMARILRALYELPEASYSCPHGRPILLRVSRQQLDRWFLRAGP